MANERFDKKQASTADGMKEDKKSGRWRDRAAFHFYLSGMEVYGTPATDEEIDEPHSSSLNTMATRSADPAR